MVTGYELLKAALSLLFSIFLLYVFVQGIQRSYDTLQHTNDTSSSVLCVLCIILFSIDILLILRELPVSLKA